VFVARAGRHELTTTVLTEGDVRDLVERMLKTTHRRIDVSTPFVDAMLPSGHRLHVVLDGITRGYSAVKTAVRTASNRQGAGERESLAAECGGRERTLTRI
jgi:pilus assembly protein CpaF